METKILVTVKTGPTLEVYPEEGKTKKDFTKEELKICNDDYKKELHDEEVKNIKLPSLLRRMFMIIINQCFKKSILKLCLILSGTPFAILKIAR